MYFINLYIYYTSNKNRCQIPLKYSENSSSFIVMIYNFIISLDTSISLYFPI